MSPDALSSAEFRLLRDYIQEHCGICLGEEKAYLIEARLTGLLARHGCPDFGTFYRLARNASSPALREEVIDAMTTNETLWFRDTHPFTILREKLLPPLADGILRKTRGRVRIWSAACSTGQEPYSIAMAILEHCRLNPGVNPAQFEILASDISPSALFLAQAGRYDENAMRRGLPEDLKERYFHREGPAWSVNDEVRRLVTFRKFNLQDSMDPLGPFDVVFCRYVTIYFADEFKRRIFAGIASLLAPSGHLLISAVESLRGIADQLLPMTHAGGLYYQCDPSIPGGEK
ncbi:CheR family methyltransferase [Mesoterricola silvestris]|uniref:protein-glutamate O-methyltransferase n=1 Tax=Mesoterricola silvestris TaxID=2927979 RepID=A0AA48K8X1_9BACT|nr:protein-glutamate O-methyltransferase CheR [Mesoterricola silvestris]BDU73384.1 chemotaxis protein methyltransferase 1 [Mesoterricola silvestris]